jgi:predicted RNA-binding Zn-ribbon protein involved in translation (DUF1610 family)
VTDGNIQAARRRLEHAVGRLVDKRPAVYHDVTLYAPSLYACLVSDLAGTQGETRTPAKSIPPVWIDAVQLRQDIDAQAHRWLPMPGTTVWRLSAIADKTYRPQDTDKVNDMTNVIDAWCESIVNLLDPQSRKEITAACPSCGKRTIYRRECGEMVRKAALVLIPNEGCTCQACDAHWSPSYYQHLARLLDISPPEGVVEEGVAS